MDTRLPNCRIVELFLTVDTSRKLQNGVNIDISIDRSVFRDSSTRLIVIFRGMEILKNDVNAVLGQIFDTKLKGNERHSIMTPGLDTFYHKALVMNNHDPWRFVYPKTRSHFS